MNPQIDMEQFRLKEEETSKHQCASSKTSKVHKKFLRGPIPLNWLSKAAALGGKALHEGLALWLLSGLRRSKTVQLSGWALIVFGVRRHAGYRALKRLQDVGLVSVDQRAGRRPVVTILTNQMEDTD